MDTTLAHTSSHQFDTATDELLYMDQMELPTKKVS